MTSLRFAAHLGFPTSQQPLFEVAAGSSDPVEQVRFAAREGLAGVLDPFAAARPEQVQTAIGTLAAELGLAMGGFLYTSFARFAEATWGSDDDATQRRLLDDIERAVAIGRRLGSRQICVIASATPDRPRADQQRTMASTLRRAGEIAVAADMTIQVEGLTRARLPSALLHGIAESAAVVRAAAHPAVRLLFDTGHCHESGEDVVEELDRHWDIVGTVQIADAPRRLAMGEGEINFGPVLDLLRDRSYGALCELEHVWAAPAPDTQFSYLSTLRRLQHGEVAAGTRP